MTLTTKEQELLKQIVDDKFSVGAFSGMIFNSVIQQDVFSDQAIENSIQLALRVRLKIKEMSEVQDGKNN